MKIVQGKIQFEVGEKVRLNRDRLVYMANDCLRAGDKNGYEYYFKHAGMEVTIKEVLEDRPVWGFVYKFNEIEGIYSNGCIDSIKSI